MFCTFLHPAPENLTDRHKISLTRSAKPLTLKLRIKEPHTVDWKPVHCLKMHSSCSGCILLSDKKCQFLCLYLLVSRWEASFTQACSGSHFHFNRPPMVIPLKYVCKEWVRTSCALKIPHCGYTVFFFGLYFLNPRSRSNTHLTNKPFNSVKKIFFFNKHKTTDWLIWTGLRPLTWAVDFSPGIQFQDQVVCIGHF